MVHQFEMGVWLLFLAYVTSAVGATIGLACANQARAATGGRRFGWLALAAVSVGGVAVWLTHFIGMLGFATPGQPIRYDVPRILLSALLAIAVVFAGLLVFAVERRSALWRLLAAGTVIGLAINVMHYTGMWAVNIKGDISYNPFVVVLSILVAVGGAIAALWFTVSAEGLPQRLLGGLVLAVASTAMYYLGMAAIDVRLDENAPDPAGVEVFSFLFPVFILAAAALAVPIVALLTTPREDDLAEDGSALVASVQ
ncbi:MHYT domain-containing protein [Actinophytocola oryzae]|uniref:NO-binding membrane sensor protein with MHYT domain n=1 Tax=Actinophytocola oryzae TaxID=502181 RepID=A0A4R7VND1_9PSEU|nr:MHYT domain-containing protein [Actinophytocola oryzae]TDV51042.1 NO-binding membrane sensor protein with MHYT domain [Actinophytocola oryzae]